MKKILLTILAVLAMTGMAMAQTAPSDINLHRNADGSWSFIMPGRNLVMSTETFSTNDTVNGHYLGGVPEGWLILALGDTVPVSNELLRRTTPITEGTPVTIVPTGNLRRIKSITLIDDPFPVGAIAGKFTINALGSQVYFSKGNLRYASGTWSFFDNQYDYLAAHDGTSWDKFGWSTSATNYGMSTSDNNGAYSGTFVDWGATMGDGWRTLSNDEWTYLFNTRESGSTVFGTENARYAHATINTDGTAVNGIILFPDGVTIDNTKVTTAGTVNAASAWGTQCTSAEWTALEAKGCVFLPAAGMRIGTSLYSVGSSCYLISSTAPDPGYAYEVLVSSGYLNVTNNNRHYGHSVRLVYPVAAAGGAPAYPLLSSATTDDLGKVVCAAGHLHDAKTAVPDGCTAVGILGKVTSTGHGLILALQNATSQNWNTINGWTSVPIYAGTTLKVLPGDAARGANLTSYPTLGETTVSNWAVAQKSDYVAIFQNLGSTKSDSEGTTYDGNVNAYITTGVSGTALSGGYWSATENDNPKAWDFASGCWGLSSKTYSSNVRPVLGF